ncbi:MAG: hypothetical protein IKQ40_06205 [Lachnospiraceae bacterium]|nr:hypothetical protein [Lachnospiraceae bacterium]
MLRFIIIIMKILIACALTFAVFAALHISKFKDHKKIILTVYGVGMILFFTVYNLRTMDYIIKFHHPFLQSVYQTDYLKTGEYPDAFLDLFLKGRTVYTPDDAYPVKDAAGEDEIDDGHYWLYHYYHAVNMWQYLDFNKNTIVKDASLNGTVLSDKQRSYFEDLGPANDMMRYTFVLSPYNGEWGNGFYHYWFYNTFIGESHVYICPEGIRDADELVVIWQDVDDKDTESYFIASKEYYDGVISK